MTRSALLSALCVFSLVACGGDDAGDETTAADWPATCDSRTSTVASEAGLCRTWSGEQTADVAAFDELCSDTFGGTFGSEEAAPCADDGVVGWCDTDQGFGLLLLYTYYDTDYDAASAQAHCEGLASCDFGCSFSTP